MVLADLVAAVLDRVVRRRRDRVAQAAVVRNVEDCRVEANMRKLSMLAAGSVAFLAGCGGGGGAVEPAASVPAVKPITFRAPVDAGVPVAQPESIDAVQKSGRTYRDDLLLLASRFPYHQVASKAFDLRPAERDYDGVQAMERVNSIQGPFAIIYQEPVDKTPIPVFEPQPYRRLSGIVIGEAVTALIEMGDGSTQLIHPGEKIPNSEWYVVSIDEEKAVLRRGGNKLPKQIVVRLESAPVGVGPNANNGGGNFGPGGPPGGFGGPNGPPGGFGGPGGPPGGFPGGGKGGSD